jgi:NADH-ubiquinone oxidoreductase chain 3
MTSTTFFFVFIPLLAIILLAVNLIFAPHNPYQEKDSVFECGFHSFLGQNRTQFSISFFIFALLFLLFDLEILLVYPYGVSAYTNGIYGLTIMLIFFLALTLGFVFELGKNALKIDSRQMVNLIRIKLNTATYTASVLAGSPISKKTTPKGSSISINSHFCLVLNSPLQKAFSTSNCLASRDT